MTWSTFLLLTIIFLLWLIISMELIGWTLQSINGMESCFFSSRNYQQTEQATSPISRYLGKAVANYYDGSTHSIKSVIYTEMEQRQV